MRISLGLCVASLLIACGSDADSDSSSSSTTDPSADTTAGDGDGATETTTTDTTDTGEDTTTEESGDTSDPNCNTRPGTYGDCVNNDWPEICEDNAASCVSDDPSNPSFGVCFLSNCFEDCDCWAAPETGTATPMCSTQVLSSGAPVCALDCSDGKTCPDGMDCINSTFCVWPVIPGGDGDGDGGTTGDGDTGGDGDGDA